MPNRDRGQPIPLRRVGIICGGWHVRTVVDLLTKPFYNNEHYLKLPVFDFRGKKRPAEVPLSRLQVILEPVKSQPDERTQIAEIPKTFFVWSNDLEEAYEDYYQYVTSSPDELPTDYGVRLSASNAPHDDLIKKCPNFGVLKGRSPKQKRRKRETAKRDREIYQRIQRLIQSGHTVNWACGRLSKDTQYSNISEGRIHRIYYLQKKMCVKP